MKPENGQVQLGNTLKNGHYQGCEADLDGAMRLRFNMNSN